MNAGRIHQPTREHAMRNHVFARLHRTATTALANTALVLGLATAPAAHAHDPRAYENYWKMRMEREAREAKAKGTTNG